MQGLGQFEIELGGIDATVVLQGLSGNDTGQY